MDDPGRLEPLSRDHAGALEEFERANRAFFAARVGDRGDDYFEHFADRLDALVREVETGVSLCFVVVDPGGAVIGRVNITDIDRPDATELGSGSRRTRRAAVWPPPASRPRSTSRPDVGSGW